MLCGFVNLKWPLVYRIHLVHSHVTWIFELGLAPCLPDSLVYGHVMWIVAPCLSDSLVHRHVTWICLFCMAPCLSWFTQFTAMFRGLVNLTCLFVYSVHLITAMLRGLENLMSLLFCLIHVVQSHVMWICELGVAPFLSYSPCSPPYYMDTWTWCDPVSVWSGHLCCTRSLYCHHGMPPLCHHCVGSISRRASCWSWTGCWLSSWNANTMSPLCHCCVGSIRRRASLWSLTGCWLSSFWSWTGCWFSSVWIPTSYTVIVV